MKKKVIKTFHFQGVNMSLFKKNTGDVAVFQSISYVLCLYMT